MMLLVFNYKCIFADLIHCTNEPNVSIPQLANLLIERSQNASWVVVFKSLITVHHLMCYGNEVSKIKYFFFFFSRMVYRHKWNKSILAVFILLHNLKKNLFHISKKKIVS